MKYDLEESYIATIRDEIPALKDPEQIRGLCVDEDGSDENNYAYFEFAQRVNDRIVLEWFQGEDHDDKFSAQMRPENPDDDSDLDYWTWRGEVTAKYITYGAGLHADMPQPVVERGILTGLLFEEETGATFVGEIAWDDSGERERVVIALFDGSE